MDKAFSTLHSFLCIIICCGTFSAISAAEEIKIGAILHLTGDLAMQSAAFREGMELAVERENGKGIADHKITLVVEDGHNNPRSSNTAAQKLLTTDNIVAGVISSYVDAMSSGPAFERAKVPVITLWDSNPKIDAIGDYVFAIGPWTPSSGEVSAKYAFEDLSARKAAVLNSQDSWSEGVAEYFNEYFEGLGGSVEGRYTLNPHDTDFRSVLTKIKASNPDVIYSPLVHNVVPFYQQIKQLGITAKVISSDIIADEHIVKAPDAFEGVFQTNLKDPDSMVFAELQRAYQQKFKKDVTLGWFVAVGFDAVSILAEAIRRGGTTSESIKEQIYLIQDFEGASTTIGFTAGGSSPQYARTFQVVNGQFKLVD